MSKLGVDHPNTLIAISGLSGRQFGAQCGKIAGMCVHVTKFGTDAGISPEVPVALDRRVITQDCMLVYTRLKQ
ncbi:hypothetical protein N7540_004553 [Penicillium herquei]|nr:hypothetical protein N7540_004553 [Penicillium herquei]